MLTCNQYKSRWLAMLAVGTSSIAMTMADDWPGGVLPLPSGFGLPVYLTLDGPLAEKTFWPSEGTYPVQSYELSGPVGWTGSLESWSHYGSRSFTVPTVTFAGTFANLRYAVHSVNQVYQSTGWWYATDYLAGEPGGGGGN